MFFNQGSNITISYAFSSGDVTTFHENNYGTSFFSIDSSGKVQFGPVSSSQNIDFYMIKGILMIIFWLFINFIGVFFAAYMKHLTYWIHVHRICSGLTALFTIVTGIYSIIDSNFFYLFLTIRMVVQMKVFMLLTECWE